MMALRETPDDFPRILPTKERISFFRFAASMGPLFSENAGHPTLIEALRATLQQIEKNSEVQANDPALSELKSSILRTISELEIRKARRISYPG